MPTIDKAQCTARLKAFLKREFPLCPSPLVNSAPLAASPAAGGVGIDNIGLIADDLEEEFDNVTPHPLVLSRTQLTAAAPVTVGDLRDLIFGRLDKVAKDDVAKAVKKCIAARETVSAQSLNPATELDGAVISIKKNRRSEYVLLLQLQFIGMIELKVTATELKDAGTVGDWNTLLEGKFRAQKRLKA